MPVGGDMYQRYGGATLSILVQSAPGCYTMTLHTMMQLWIWQTHSFAQSVPHVRSPLMERRSRYDTGTNASVSCYYYGIIC